MHRGRWNLLLVAIAGLGSVAPIPGAMVATRPAAAAGDPVVMAAGDIACDPTDASYNGGAGRTTACRQRYTSDLLVASPVDAVLALGDTQYNSGSLSQFQQSFDPTWGRRKSVTKPVIGNHEGTTSTGGGGYCSYFGAAAHCNAKGQQGQAAFYSWDVGTWHMIALNSNCTAAGGCDVGSPQHTWLQNDLATHRTDCTLAYWHHPRFSSGHDGDNLFMQPIWKLLYDEGADLVLSGHSHDYERFAPMDGDGRRNEADGMRQMVVGTGGNSFTGLGTTIEPNSEAQNNNTFGVLKLALHPTGYDWNFLPEAGRTFTDAGNATCRDLASVGDTQAPTAPSTLDAQAAGPTQVDLSWAASTDNVGVAGYEIWRGQPGMTSARIATTTGTGTTYADTTVTAGASFDYQVRARDGAGNVSPFSGVQSVTTPTAGSSTLTFASSDDATIDQSNPAAALGTGSRITVDSSPVNDLLVKFTVSGTGPGTSCPTITSAKLRLTVGNTADNGSVKGGDFRAAADSNWSESTVTWSNAPAASPGPPVASIVTPVALGTAYLVDVTPVVTGDGPITIRANGNSSDGARYYSRNGNPDSLAPELRLTCATTSGSSLSFAASDDATIDAALPTTTLGTGRRLALDSGPVKSFLTKFTVSGTGTGTSCPTITSAKLRLTVGDRSANGSVRGGDFRAAVDSNWSESSVTWETAPAPAPGAPVSSITTPVAPSTAYLVDVTPLVTGNGTITIRADGNTNNEVRYYSRNANPGSLAPELQVTCG